MGIMILGVSGVIETELILLFNSGQLLLFPLHSFSFPVDLTLDLLSIQSQVFSGQIVNAVLLIAGCSVIFFQRGLRL